MEKSNYENDKRREIKISSNDSVCRLISLQREGSHVTTSEKSRDDCVQVTRSRVDATSLIIQ